MFGLHLWLVGIVCNDGWCAMMVGGGGWVLGWLEKQEPTLSRGGKNPQN